MNPLSLKGKKALISGASRGIGLAIAHALARAAGVSPLEVKELNPLSMWDLRYTRELDEEGFFDRLYRR